MEASEVLSLSCLSGETRNKDMTQLSEKLLSIKQQLKPSSKASQAITAYPNLLEYKADGEDHVNVGNNAKTQYGRLLSNGYKCRLEHPVFGNFTTIEGFWNYLKTGDDRFRSPTRNIGDLREVVKSRSLPGFQYLILEAIYYKLKAYRKRLIDLGKPYAGLPLDVYYLRMVKTGDSEPGYIPVRVTYFDWYLRGLKEVISAVIEQREPDLTEFLGGLTKEEVYNQFIRRDKPQEPKSKKEKNQEPNL
jgi:hypothetical protein